MSGARVAGETLNLIRQATIHAVTVHGRLSLRDEVVRILEGGDEWQGESAAKYLDRLRQVREEAWDEGEAAGQDNADSNRGFDVEHKYNPYRSDK